MKLSSNVPSDTNATHSASTRSSYHESLYENQSSYFKENMDLENSDSDFENEFSENDNFNFNYYKNLVKAADITAAGSTFQESTAVTIVSTVIALLLLVGCWALWFFHDCTKPEATVTAKIQDIKKNKEETEVIQIDLGNIVVDGKETTNTITIKRREKTRYWGSTKLSSTPNVVKYLVSDFTKEDGLDKLLVKNMEVLARPGSKEEE